MQRQILAYGHGILKKECHEIEKSYPGLVEIISDMWETMRKANGCGLAAPQIGLPIKLFVVDSKTTFENLDEQDRQNYFDRGIAETFINAKITERSEETWEDEEGCLSIPRLNQNVRRSWGIKIEYFDKDFQWQTKSFSGATARMVQHEYDHTLGILYLDYLKPLVKRLMAPKLKQIMKGRIRPEYPMRFI